MRLGTLWTTVFCALLTAAEAPAQRLLWLGRLPGGSTSEARAVSDSGPVVVGRAENVNYYWRAVRWTETEGLISLGTLGGSSSEATGISPDGRFIVGKAQDSLGRWRAVLWSSGGMRELGTLGGRESEAAAVSALGAVVGKAANSSLQLRAFLWSETAGMRDLGTLGGAESAALSIARDSLVIVGWAENPDRNPRAFRWTPVTGMLDLGTLGGIRSEAYGVSADGSVVVGRAENSDRLWRAFRWTAATGMLELGTLGGRESAALAVSADGSTIVGWAATPSGDWHAVRWTPSTGLQDLNVVYARLLGLSILYAATGVSASGRYIVGYGINAATGRQEAFLLDTEPQIAIAEPPAGAALPYCYPTVVTGAGTLLCYIPEGMRAELLLTDLLGRPLALPTTELPAGEHRLQLPYLAPGTYFLVLRLGAAVFCRPVCVLQ